MTSSSWTSMLFQQPQPPGSASPTVNYPSWINYPVSSLAYTNTSNVVLSEQLTVAAEYQDIMALAGLVGTSWVSIQAEESPTFDASQPATVAAVLAPSMSSWLTGLAERLLDALTHIAALDSDEPVYEAGPSQVDWDRLRQLRQAHAIESNDLFEWYAQQE
jgi:hypothetical protein